MGEIKKSGKSYIMDDFEDDEGSENDDDSAENISSIPTTNEVKICSVFGPPSGPIKTEALFSPPSASSSIFHGLDLSASKQLPSFATISTVDKPIFGTKTEGFSFAGAGQSIFSASRNSGYGNNIDEANESHVEDNDHDPHFEPIVPLPDLVEVSTGEEEEEETFRHRAKVYRYDKETKQWKERGVGDMKILRHPTKQTFRVLFRRDQTHKIACNHVISEAMQLKPMSTSETALTWYAVDHADGEGKTEHLAVKFKLAETKNEFKSAFEAAQEALRQN